MALQPRTSDPWGLYDPFALVEQEETNWPTTFWPRQPQQFGMLGMPGMGMTDVSPYRTLAPILRSQRQEMSPYSPILRADLIETENDYSVHVDLPGTAREDLDISVEDGMLHIKAERKHQYAEDSGSARKIERSFGRMERVLKLPRSAKADEARVTFDNGVLSISFPKAEGAVKRTRLQIT